MNEVANVYLFFCPMDLSYLYLYGAKIYFINDSVNYENSILSPGQAIISWNNRNLNTNFIPSMLLPNLESNKKYRFIINSKEFPNNSVSISLTLYDKNNEQIKFDIYDEKVGTFELKKDVANYKIELVNIGNNRKLKFDNCIIGQDKFLQNCVIKTDYVDSIRLIWVKNKKPELSN